MKRKLLFTPIHCLVMASIVMIASWADRSEAKVLKYKPLSMAVEKDDRMEIRGFVGKVSLIANESAKTVTVSLTQRNPDKYSDFAKALYDEWHFSFRREGNVLQANVQSPTSKHDWGQLVAKGGLPEFDIEVIAPSRAVSLNWHKGNISLKNWQAPFSISLQQGKIAVSKTKGDGQISVKSGEITVNNHEGALAVDSYKAAATIRNIKGPLKFENYVGGSELFGIDGEIELSSYKGRTNVKNSKGRIEFKNGRSLLDVSKFEGTLRGKTLEGPVRLYVVGEADVRVRSKSGNISVRAPGSGAWGNFGTEEGTLFVPTFLKLSRLPNIKIRQGRLRGAQKGKIFVRTESGDIRLR